MTEPTPAPASVDNPPEPDETDYGKGIYDRLGELNERLKGWDGLLSHATNTETSSETTPAADVLATRATATPDSQTTPENVNSPTSGETSSGAPVGDSRNDPPPTVDPAPAPPKADNQTTSRKGLGFLKGGKKPKS